LIPHARRTDDQRRSARAGRRSRAFVGVLSFGLALAACQPGPASRSGAIVEGSAATYQDPFAYCAAVGTIDRPDAGYVGPAVPASVARGLARAFGVTADPPPESFRTNSYWRCMNGAVYACTVGANLPCLEKPPADPEPTDAMRTFCREQPGSAGIPAYITSHATLYDWSCDESRPKRGRVLTTLDERGYMSSIWHRLSGP